MKTIYLYSVVLFIFAGLTACQNKESLEEEQLISIDEGKSLSRSINREVLDSVSVNNEGTLVFATETAYRSIVNTLLQFTDEELDSWENSIGFYSLRKKLNEIFHEAYTLNDVTLFSSFVEQYPTFVKQEYGNLTPIVGAQFYRNILNLENTFYIGKDKYEVLDESNVRITVGKEEKTRNNNSNVITFEYSEPRIHSSDLSTFAYPPSYPPGVDATYRATGLEGVELVRNGDVRYTYAPYYIDNFLVVTYKLIRNLTKPQKVNAGYMWSSEYFITLEMYSYGLYDDKWIYYIPNDYIFEAKEIYAYINVPMRTDINTIGTFIGIENDNFMYLGSNNPGYYATVSKRLVGYGIASGTFANTLTLTQTPPPMCELNSFKMKARIYPFTYGASFGYNTPRPNPAY